jgi:hypothetical protein
MDSCDVAGIIVPNEPLETSLSKYCLLSSLNQSFSTVSYMHNIRSLEAEDNTFLLVNHIYCVVPEGGPLRPKHVALNTELCQ